MVSLLSAANSSSIISIHIAEVAAGILARISERIENRISLSDTGAIPVLTEWLDEGFTNYPRMQEAALDALSSICKDNAQFSTDVVGYTTQSREKAISIMFKMIRDRRPAMRLSSSTWYSQLKQFNASVQSWMSSARTLVASDDPFASYNYSLVPRHNNNLFSARDVS
jgi:hypothetical protein